MRDDIWVTNPDGSIYLDPAGGKLIDVRKVIGKGYTNGWFTNCKARYRFFEGARSTKKSYNMIGYESIFKIITDPNRNIMILRQNDVDNYQTTYTQVLHCISDLGFDNRFKTTKSPREIIYIPTGQKIIFRGLNNPTSLNSINFTVGQFTDVYIDEAYEVKDYGAYEKLDGSIRGILRSKGCFYQLTCCLNPWSADTWIYTDFFKGRLEDNYDILSDDRYSYMDYYDPEFQGEFGKGLYLHKSTYKVNEFRDKENYDKAANSLKENVPSKYKVFYLGMWGAVTGPVYSDWKSSLVKEPEEIFARDAYGKPFTLWGDFAIGIDTGLSNNQGGKRVVKKGEDPKVRIRSATTMQLCAVTADNQRMYVLDEYFHSNAKGYNDINTDNTDDMSQTELTLQCVKYIKLWINKYGGDPNINRIMKGTIDIFVDGADQGFRDALRIELRRQNVYNVQVFGTGRKTNTQSRVDFEDAMMGYGDFIVSSRCKNLIREIKNARRGEKGEAREDTDDHALTAMEYGMARMIVDLKRYKDLWHD